MQQLAEQHQVAHQERVLLSYDEDKATKVIDTARDQVLVFQEFIDEYHGLGFPRKINDMPTLVEFFQDPSEFVFQERLKGDAINPTDFLKGQAVTPPDVVDYLDRICARPAFDAKLYLVDEDGQVCFDEERVEGIEEQFKVYAVGRQVEAYHALQQLAESAAKLSDLGFDVSIPNLMRLKTKYFDGLPTRFVYPPDLCLKIKPTL